MIDPEFYRLNEELDKSLCGKRRVAAGTYLADGLFVTGTNTCVAPITDGVCHRMKVTTGEAYDLCNSTHAEIDMLEIVAELGEPHPQRIVWVLGHYYACIDCATQLRAAGFREIRVREYVS